MKREFLTGLMADLPKGVIDAIMEENGRDIQAARQKAAAWEEKYNQAVAEHKAALEEAGFQSRLRESVTRAGGRNQTAIAALLDLQSLRQSQDPAVALEAALEKLKQECGYLFAPAAPPVYAAGTGTADTAPREQETLADALRARFDRG